MSFQRASECIDFGMRGGLSRYLAPATFGMHQEGDLLYQATLVLAVGKHPAFKPAMSLRAQPLTPW